MKIPASQPLPRLLVTGVRGLLASRIVPELRRYFGIRTTDILPVDTEGEYHAADLTIFDHVLPLMRDVDVVLHCAAASHLENPPAPIAGKLQPDDEKVMRVNVQGTYNVFEAARRAGVRKIVYLSSLTAHLGDKARTWYDEATPVDPVNLYACTKIFGDNLGRVFAREHGLSVICLRLGQPYPLHERLDDVWRKNRRARSWFVTVEDITDAVISALRAEVSYGLYNIVSGSDNPRFDISDAREIGYIPRGYFSEAGLAFYDHGKFPAQAGPATTHVS